MRQRELDLDRPALCIDQRRNGQHPRRETLAGEGVGQDAGRLADLQLSEIALVDLRHQLQRASQCQSQQRMPGLYDLAGLDQARQHLGIGGGHQHGLRQARPGGGGGGTGQCELCLRLQHIGALLCVGHALGARAGLLRLRDGSRTTCLVESRVTEKTSGYQRLRPLQVGLRSRQYRIRLRHRGLRRAAPGAAQPRQARSGLALAGLRLLQRGVQFVGFHAHQLVTLADLCAFIHQHLQHAAGQRAAHIDAGERGHPSRELQRSHQGSDAQADRRHGRRAGGPPDEQTGGKGGDSGQDEDRAAGHL